MQTERRDRSVAMEHFVTALLLLDGVKNKLGPSHKLREREKLPKSSKEMSHDFSLT